MFHVELLCSVISTLNAARFTLVDGQGGSVVGLCSVDELIQDLRCKYGNRLSAISS